MIVRFGGRRVSGFRRRVSIR